MFSPPIIIYIISTDKHGCHIFITLRYFHSTDKHGYVISVRIGLYYKHGLARQYFYRCIFNRNILYTRVPVRAYPYISALISLPLRLFLLAILSMLPRNPSLSLTERVCHLLPVEHYPPPTDTILTAYDRYRCVVS